MRKAAYLWITLLWLGAGTAGAVTYNLQGFVKNGSGTGIAGVTIDLYDPVTNTKATALQNITLANGQYNAFFTPANPTASFFYLDFAPQAQTGYAAIQLKDQRFAQPTVILPDTVLPAAFAVDVNVWDPTGTLPQANVDLDFYDVTTGVKVYTPGVSTGGGGNATADLPPGVYDVLATPPRAGPYGPQALYARRITAATTLDVNLVPGSLVQGTVTDTLGNPLDLVYVGVRDAATGRLLATRYRTTAGVFSFFLATGAYDLTFDPPAGSDLLPARVAAYAVPGAALNVTLVAGTPVTGRVVDGAASPVYLARFGAEIASTGQGVDLSRARTDSTGAFRFSLGPGAYWITVNPPEGTRLLAKTLPVQSVGGTPVDLGTISLGQGFVVTGRVTGGGQPVTDVNVNARDSRSGHQVPTSRDHTGLDGGFRMVVPAGTYDMEFLPPVGTTWNATQRNAVGVTADLALTPDVVLSAGAKVTATIQGQGAGPLEDASVGLYDPLTGHEILLAHHSSSSVGTVETEVAAGTYDLRVVPPPASEWLPLERLGVAIAAPSTSLGTLTLERGVLLQGVVKSVAPPSAGIHDVNVNVYDPATGAQLLSSRDHSDPAGHFSFAIRAGTWDVEFLPPPGTRFLPRTRSGIAVPAGGLVLSDTFLETGFLVTGRTVDSVSAAPVVDVNLEFDDAGTGVHAPTAHDHSSFDGRFETTLPAGSYLLHLIPAITDPHAVKTVATGAISTDKDLGDIALLRGFFVGGTVRNASSQPVGDVAISVAQSGTGTPVETARNVTDPSGRFDWMVLPGGTYDFTATPPPASGYLAKIAPGVSVSADNHNLLSITLDLAPPRPTVTGVNPSSGSARGGTNVTITGTNLTGATAVTLGGMPLQSFTAASATQITGTTAARPAGTVDVAVTTPAGTGILPQGYTYTESAPPVVLKVQRTAPGADVRLDWTATGQPDYTVYRTADPRVFDAASKRTTTAGTTYTLGNEVGSGSIAYYCVE